MKRQIKIRPLKKPRIVRYDSGASCTLELLVEMGYNIYEHPGDGDFCIVSPKRLTFRDVRNQAVYYGIDPKWWDSENAFEECMKDELDHVNL
jgi:hypothetical protein